MPERSAARSKCPGREAELAQLGELYRRAQQQDERFALVQGPSGVGKSRILHELRGRIRLEGGPVLEGRCEPGRAFGPFAEIVDRALRFLDEVGVAPSVELEDLGCREGCHRFWYQHAGTPAGTRPEQPRTLGDGTGLEARRAREGRLRFFDAIDGLLRDVAAVRPPVVLLHDLERADQGTLELLRAVLDGTGPWSDGMAPDRSLRALIAASLRTDTGTLDEAALDALRRHDRSTVIDVGQLDEEGVRAYLQSPETVARVLERTGGMPESIDLLLEADPLSPEARLERELTSLSPVARRMVEALAVVTHPSDTELLAGVAGVEADQAAHTEFSQCDLLARSVVDGRILFSFARESSRERAYALLDEQRRRALHARCADLFSARPNQAQEAAWHALRAGALERAVPLALDAARSLSARHAHEEAAALLEKVGEASGESMPTDVAAYLAELYRVTGDYRSALVHAQTVRERNAGSTAATQRVGDLQTLAGRLDEAADTLEQAHRLADGSGDPDATVEVEALLAELHYQRASYDEARNWAHRALEAARERSELRLEIHARNTLGKCALAQKDAAHAAQLFEENHRKASESGLGHQEAQALTNLGVALLRRQELGAAEQAFSEAITVATRVNDTRERAIATENLAVLAHLRRDYATALTSYHEAVALLKRLGNRAMLTRVANNLGELYLSLGERQRAGALCEFAAQMGGTGLPPSVAGEGLLLRGRVEAANAHTGAARAAFEASKRTFEQLGEGRVVDAQLELARLALTEGDVAGAREVLAQVPVPESPKLTAEIALVSADIERAGGGETLKAAQRAVERAEQTGDDQLLLPALVRLARARSDQGELSMASRVLERAQEVEARLTDHVPDEAADAWVERPARGELAAVESQLATAWRAIDRDPGAPARRSRSSSLPPPPSRNEQRARVEQWRQKYPQIVGNSPTTHSMLQLLDKVAPTDALVLVRGESGTGKELIAEALHANSPRSDHPIVKVNCAALVETLLLSELFGHERGAFTGANARKKGRFELADGGTIFLDEIGDISPKTQMALLRVLQEREFERVGGTQPIKVNVRIIAATHRDLEAMVREGTFREDLYYRLRGVMIETPPLRRRLEDLGDLCDHLLRRIASERGEAPKTVSPETVELLAGHRWPGNIRELDNVLRSATLFAEGEVLRPEDFAAFSEAFQAPEPETSVEAQQRAEASDGAEQQTVEDHVYDRIRDGSNSLLDMKKELERECIVRALDETDGNITRAAQLLGMKRPRLSQLVKQYGLQAAEK